MQSSLTDEEVEQLEAKRKKVIKEIKSCDSEIDAEISRFSCFSKLPSGSCIVLCRIIFA